MSYRRLPIFGIYNLSQPASIVRLREQFLKSVGFEAHPEKPNVFIYVRRLGILRAFEDQNSGELSEVVGQSAGLDFVIWTACVL